MSLEDLIILNDKIEKLESKLEKAEYLLRVSVGLLDKFQRCSEIRDTTLKARSFIEEYFKNKEQDKC